MQRFMSLWLPSLATDRLNRSRQAGQPVAVVARHDDCAQVVAVDAAAAALGVHPGAALAGLRALGAAIRLVDADPAADRRALDDLADWCGQYAPHAAIELDGASGTIMVDVSRGVAAFGGETAVLRMLMRRIRAFGYAVRGAIAGTYGAAWALARFDLRAGDGLVVDDSPAAALAPLPVAGLRLGAGAERLAQAGCETIGAALAMPPAQIAGRAGMQAVRRLDQAVGRTAETLIPRRAVAACRVRHGFADPIGVMDPLVAALRSTLGALAGRLERAERGVRRLELALYRLDGGVRRLPIELPRPTRDPELLMRLLGAHLDKLDLSAGVEALVVSALETESGRPVQLELPQPVVAPSFSVVERLAERLGVIDAARAVGRSVSIERRRVPPLRRGLSGRPVGERRDESGARQRRQDGGD